MTISIPNTIIDKKEFGGQRHHREGKASKWTENA